jgi:kynureninase
MNLETVQNMDASDPLGDYRNKFFIADPDLCYLDGNSLGRLPRATIDALAQVTVDGWGTQLVTGWEYWIDMAQRVGDRFGVDCCTQPKILINPDVL